MLSQADLNTIQTVFGKTAEELSGAISSTEEVSLDLRLNGRVISQIDEQSLKTTLTDAGVEIGYKNLAKALKLELGNGEKDPSIIAEKLKNTLSASYEEKYKNMTPPEQLVEAQNKSSEWESKYNKLSETYEASSTEIKEWEGKYSTLQTDIKNKEINNIILKSFPDKMKFEKDDALVVVRNSISFEETDGGVIAKKGNEIILDPVGKPQTIDNVVKSFVEEKKWVKGLGMNGADRGAPGSQTKMTPEAAEKYLVEKGLDPGHGEGLNEYMKLTSQTTEE